MKQSSNLPPNITNQDIDELLDMEDKLDGFSLEEIESIVAYFDWLDREYAKFEAQDQMLY